jgi:ribosome modulation factor
MAKRTCKLAVATLRGNFRRAYWRGREDQQAGKTIEDCPYHDIRGNAGHVTFSRAYRNAWISGFSEAEIPYE